MPWWSWEGELQELAVGGKSTGLGGGGDVTKGPGGLGGEQTSLSRAEPQATNMALCGLCELQVCFHPGPRRILLPPTLTFSPYLFVEIGEGREKERERNIGVKEKRPSAASRTHSEQGLDPQPRHMP